MSGVVLRHQRYSHIRTQLTSNPFQRFANASDIVWQDQQANNEAPLQASVFTRKYLIGSLSKHLGNRGPGVFCVVGNFGVRVTSIILRILQIRKVDINNSVEQSEYFH